MHVEFMRVRKAEMPRIPDAAKVRSARIWACQFRSLQQIAECVNIEALEILSFPDSTFNAIASLQSLTYLRIIHFPDSADAAPLASLSRLQSLALETSPSWDSEGKVHVVNSLEPFASLSALRHVQLFGVQSPDKSLRPLERCTSLVSGRFSKFPAEEVRRFYHATGVSDDWVPMMPVSAAG